MSKTHNILIKSQSIFRNYPGSFRNLSNGVESPKLTHQTDNDVVILGGARTPFGGFGGSLSTISADKLAGIAIKAAVERSGVQMGDIDEVG